MKTRVLFLCIHNSARSQMAAAFLKHKDAEHFDSHSAGLEAGKLNARAVEVMREVGIDISQAQPQTIDELLARGERFDVVVSVCDAASAERCPFIPGNHRRLHWPFDDPSAFSGSLEEQLNATRRVRDEIASAVDEFINEEMQNRGVVQ